ncbi:MAG TPA: hypothetical protein VFF73_26355, partial [Planctomycetota bacterium]|nr:hypothetical protein [Planctomycetota bacterium]
LPNAVPTVDANHAFVFAPPNQYLDGKTHSIQFFGVNQPDGVNPELGGSPTMFVGQKNNPPQGFLDVGNTTVAAGWAYDPDAGAAPVSVEIWIDNALYQTVTANQTRPDLVPIVAPEPTHGFSCSMPDSLNDGKFHSIRAFAINVPSGPKQELAASPKEINAQAPYIGIWVKDTAQGLQISQVAAGRAGATAGLCAGDIIRAYDGNTDKLDYSAFIAWVQTKEVGEQVVFRLWRDPSLPAPPPPNPPVPSSQATPPLGTGERLVIVTLGSR